MTGNLLNGQRVSKAQQDKLLKSGGENQTCVIDSVCEGVQRILAPNPKDYTGTGTNTYVVGAEKVWVIDPGPAEIRHVDAVLAAVDGRQVEGICVTHTHLDHSPAATLLKQETGSKTYGFGALSPDIFALTSEDVDCSFVPDVILPDRRTLGSGDWCLQALHTPGHFPNHMCYLLPQQGILFSGDHVMGWSTTVIVPPLGSLLDYMDSLNVLEQCNANIMLPSHGEIVEAPNTRIDEVRQHRKMRHEQVRACLKTGITEPSAIVGQIYEDLPPRLIEAAQGSVMAHIEVLDMETEAASKNGSGLCLTGSTLLGFPV